MNRLNPAKLPSVTRARFALFFVIALLLAFSVGQTFVQLNSPPISSQAVAPQTLLGGLYGVLISLGLACVFYLLHPVLRKRSFGRARQLASEEPLAQRVKFLSKRIGIDIPELLVDQNIWNCDALTFGSSRKKYILLGRGLSLLLQKKPKEADVRLAHEIGHIKNGDIGITFFAQALIASSACLLGAAVLHYVSINTYMYYNGWLHWKAAGFDVWAFLSAQGAQLKIVFTFVLVYFLKLISWAAFLYVENKRFLRVRELYADNISVMVVGAEQVVAVFKRQREASFIARLLSAHPNPDVRRAIVEAPIRLIEPRLGSLFFTGYIVGVAFFTLSTLRDLPSSAASSLLEFLRDVISLPNLAVMFVVISFLLIPLAIALGSVVFRFACCISLRSDNKLITWGRAVAGSLAIAVGAGVGGDVNPQRIDFILFGGWSAISLLLPRADGLLSLIILTVIIFVGISISALYMHRFFRAERAVPPSRIAWFGLGFFVYAVLAQGFGMFLLVITTPNISAQVILLGLGMCLFYFLMGYLISRRTLSIAWFRNEALAPWLFAVR
jgi:Zn-dependent protease with chaperone function